MLRQLRSPKLRKILMIALAVIVIPSFIVVYGWQSGSGPGLGAAPQVAATVNYGLMDKREIGPYEMQRAKQFLAQRMGNYAMQQGLQVDQMTINRLISARPVLDEAINLAILEEYAREHGITATTAEATDFLQQQIPAQARQFYLQQLQQQGRSLSDAVEDIRQFLLLEKVRESLGARVRVTNYEAWLDYAARNMKLTADVARFDLARFLEKIEVQPNELEAFFEKNKEDYRVPEQVQYNFILVRKDDLRSSVTVTEDDLTSAYEGMKEEFRLPPTAEVRTIFLAKPVGEDAATTAAEGATTGTEAVRTKAEDIYQRAAKGENFAGLADQFSELKDFPPRETDADTTGTDTQTTAGGYLGRINRNVAQNYFGDEWTSAVFNAAPGAIVPPIETENGFHIIKVDSKREGLLQPLDKVTELVRNRVLQEKTQPLFEEIGDKLADTAEKNPSLEAIARETGQQVQTTPKVNRDAPFIPQIGLLGEFQMEFVDLEKGGVTPFLSDQTRHLIAEVKEEFPAHLPNLDEVREQVTQDFKQQKALQMAEAAAKEVAAKAKDLESFKAAAGDAGSTPTQTRPFTPSEAQAILGPVQNFEEMAASLKKGDIRVEKLGRDEIPLGYVVFHITEKQEPAQQEFAKELPTLLPQLLQQKQQVVLNEFLRDQRAELKDQIEVSEFYQQQPE